MANPADVLWSFAFRVRYLAKRASLLDPLEPLLLRMAPRMIPPPRSDTEVLIPFGLRLLVPAGYSAARSYGTGLYEPAVTRFFKSTLKNGMTVLDLGAHVGYYTVLASRLVGPSGRVYAFEPDPVTYRYLVLNVEANSCANVVTVNRAVSDRAETASFLHDPYGAESHLTGTPVVGAIDVQTVTLDDFFSGAGWPRVDLVKVDVEGSEPKVLGGMSLLSRRNPGMLLIMELNWPAWHRAGTARDALTGVLRELAYTEGYLMEKGMHPFSVLRAFPSTRGNYNLLLAQQRSEESANGLLG